MALRRDRWKRTQFAHKQVSSVMSELATAPKPDGVIAKTSRRVAVALTMSIGVGLLMIARLEQFSIRTLPPH